MSVKNRTVDDKASGQKLLACVASTTVAFALSRGMTIDEVESVTGVSGIELMSPDARLPDETVANLWRVLAPLEPDVALSVEMARAAPLSIFGGLAHGAQFALDLRSALNFMIEHRSFLADRVSIEIQETPTEAAFVVSHPLDKVDRGRMTEVGLGLAWRLINEILNIEVRPTRIEFAYPGQGPQDAYEKFFGAPVLFEQPRNALLLRTEDLNAPVRQANVELFAFAEQYFDQIRRRMAHGDGPAELVALRNAVVENASAGDYRPISAAARAGLSLRSAQRLTASNGMSLQQLIDEVRAASAQEFLADPKVDIGSVAVLVGYSDDRAFRRAFKRWTGQTPSEFRSLNSKK